MKNPISIYKSVISKLIYIYIYTHDWSRFKNQIEYFIHLVEYRKTSIYFFRRKFSLNFSTSHRVHNLASRSERYTIFAVSALIGAENKEAILENTLASRATGKNK